MILLEISIAPDISGILARVAPEISPIADVKIQEESIPEIPVFGEPVGAGSTHKGPPGITVRYAQPQVLKRVKPVYPDFAREAHLEGTVFLEVTIDSAGRVMAARLLNDAPPILVRAATEAVLQWVFKPGKQRDVSVVTKMNIPFEFTLR